MKRQILAFILLMAAASICPGCRPPRGTPAFQPVSTQRIYKLPFDRVWDATMAVLSEDLQFRLEVVERSTGTIATEWVIYERKTGGYDETEKVTVIRPTEPIFVSYRLIVLVKITPEGTMVRVRRYQKQCIEHWSVVPTDLQFERQILVLVDKRLGVINP